MHECQYVQQLPPFIAVYSVQHVLRDDIYMFIMCENLKVVCASHMMVSSIKCIVWGNLMRFYKKKSWNCKQLLYISGNIIFMTVLYPVVLS